MTKTQGNISPKELGDQWKDSSSPFCAQAGNHRLAPGGPAYWTRYCFVRGQTPRSAKVLDVGCNCGQLAKNLYADLDCEVWGVDLVADFIESCRTCREADKLGQFFVANFGILTEGDLAAMGMLGTFDAVTALEVIEHPLDLLAFRRNVAHVLKPGGRLIITTPHKDSPKAGQKYLATHVHHVRMWTRASLTSFFGEPDVYAELWSKEHGPHIAAAWTIDLERRNEYLHRDPDLE